jgi:hypothetical protein
MNVQTISDKAPDWAHSLVEALSSIEGAVNIEQACELLRGLSVTTAEVLDSSRFEDTFYTRTSIFRTSELEVLIMGWLAG